MRYIRATHNYGLIEYERSDRKKHKVRQQVGARGRKKRRYAGTWTTLGLVETAIKALASYGVSSNPLEWRCAIMPKVERQGKDQQGVSNNSEERSVPAGLKKSNHAKAAT